jgi:hypothetical protein
MWRPRSGRDVLSPWSRRASTIVGKRTCNYFLRTLELKAPRLVGLGANNQEEIMGRGLLLWLIGIPIPIILLIWLFGGLH